MVHKRLFNKPGRYPFERKYGWQTPSVRSLNRLPAHSQAAKSESRLVHWDRSKQVKKYA